MLAGFYYALFKQVNSQNNALNGSFILIASTTVILIHALVDNPFYDPATRLVFWFNLGIMSSRIKDRMISNSKNKSTRTISFRNSIFHRLSGLLLLLFCIFNISKKVSGYIYWQAGQNQVAGGDWVGGIKKYEKALKVFPDNGELQFHLGSAYVYTKQAQKAIDLLNRAAKKFNDKNLYIVKGYALIQSGRFKEAEKCFHTVLRMYPELMLPRLWLAQLYLKTNREKYAINELNHILRINPKIMTDNIKKIKQDAYHKLNQLKKTGLVNEKVK